MQITQRRATGNHHPHRELWISRLPWTPLPLGYKKVLHLLHITCAQDGI